MIALSLSRMCLLWLVGSAESFIAIDILRVVERMLKIVDQGGITLGFIKYKEAA